MKTPRVMIAATRAKSGKTLISCSIMSALAKLGLKVQPFKVGPDFIDPSYHSIVSELPSRNLDSYMFTRDKLMWAFASQATKADVSVIEGVFGLYDSPDGLSERGSSAEVAKLLRCPVILVVNAERANRSLLATIQGFREFDPEVQIKGIILNRVGTQRQEQKIRAAVHATETDIEILGAIPRSAVIEEQFKYRHLGLVPTSERARELEELRSTIATTANHLDIIGIRNVAQTTEDLVLPEPRRETQTRRNVAVGVIRDKAFSFYYPENLEYLEVNASRVHYIDSFADTELPDIDLLYVGGGFPEVYAAELQKNEKLMDSIRKSWSAGMHIYAECGGLMYLASSIVDTDGESHKSVGLIDGVVHVEKTPVGHGYVRLQATMPNPLTTLGTELVGHEFHHSRLEFGHRPAFAFQVLRGHGIDGVHDGILRERLIAMYTHLHVHHNPSLFGNLLASASHRNKRA
jgi:cobyrinic acid a,c-diamide synthase